MYTSTQSFFEFRNGQLALILQREIWHKLLLGLRGLTLTPLYVLFFLFFIQIIAIFAFATVAGFIGHFEFTVRCNGGSVSSREVKGDFFYPFNEIKLYVSDKLCENETTTKAKENNLKINYKSESEYFVFTGVVSMLFVIAAVVYYVFFEDRAKEATSTDIGYCSFPVVVSFMLINVFCYSHCYLLLWLPISYRIKFKILYLTFKCLDDQALNYPINLITIRRQSRYSLRSNEAPLLVPPSISTVLHWVIVHSSQLHLVSGMHYHLLFVILRHLMLLKLQLKLFFFFFFFSF